MLSAAVPASWFQAFSAPQLNGTVAFRPDRFLIKINPIKSHLLEEFHRSQKTKVLSKLGNNLEVLSIPDGQSITSVIRRYKVSGLVEYAEPDYLLRIAAITPNDPAFTSNLLWGLHNSGENGGVTSADIDAPEAWQTLTSASNVIVAVLDTGVRYSHEDLVANIWTKDGTHGTNALAGTTDPDDDNGHGTLVAGTIGAEGNSCGSGVAHPNIGLQVH
jgi:subtilisin family serine protease